MSQDRKRRAVATLVATDGSSSHTFFVLEDGKIRYESSYSSARSAIPDPSRPLPHHCETFAQYFDTMAIWWSGFKHLRWNILPGATEEEKVEMLLMKLRTGL